MTHSCREPASRFPFCFFERRFRLLSTVKSLSRLLWARVEHFLDRQRVCRDDERAGKRSDCLKLPPKQNNGGRQMQHLDRNTEPANFASAGYCVPSESGDAGKRAANATGS